MGQARNPPVFLQNGDSITIEIEGVGTPTNPVRRYVADGPRAKPGVIAFGVIPERSDAGESREAAVHRHHDPSDKGGGRREQPQRRPGQIIRRAKSPGRGMFDDRAPTRGEFASRGIDQQRPVLLADKKPGQGR